MADPGKGPAPLPPYLIIFRSRSGTALVHLEGSSILDIPLFTCTCVNHLIYFCFLFSAFLNRDKKSLRHVTMAAIFLDLKKPWSSKNGRKNEKIDVYDFPVHDCTQELNGSPYFSSIDRQCKCRLCQERLLRSRNFAIIDSNVTSHSPLY